ncbi:hypothetical protein FDP41_004566 [Naegleria fowleri]|uniref:Uncharacterized protein n=1 Tax=Naegleria fowleri TaxID=5763 RepID=A0A6A5BI85_NAEFO|nr:uncharacterized protein FDP41_004566 [Naegleria fowleri]KAF0976667.1 hypothetical protein FDP41_004566 [Naegleria fowleri]
MSNLEDILDRPYKIEEGDLNSLSQWMAQKKELEEQVKTLEMKLVNQNTEHMQQCQTLIKHLSEQGSAIKDLQDQLAQTNGTD